MPFLIWGGALVLCWIIARMCFLGTYNHKVSMQDYCLSWCKFEALKFDWFGNEIIYPKLWIPAINSRFLRPCNCCDIVFQEGKSVLEGLSFLHLCKKYDICIGNRDAWTCCFGKITQVLNSLIFIGYSQYIINGKVEKRLFLSYI